MIRPLPDWFQYPPGSAAPCNVEAQQLLWTSGLSCWRPFITILDTAFRPGKLAAAGPLEARLPGSIQPLSAGFSKSRACAAALIGVCRADHQATVLARIMSRTLTRHGDIVYVGMDDRDLTFAGAIANSAGISGRIDTLDLRCFYRPDDRPRLERQAISTWWRINDLVRDNGLYLPENEADFIAESLLCGLLWERARHEIDFPNHFQLRVWHEPLAATVAWDADPNSSRVEARQHSIVTCPSSFSPLPIDRLHCLGGHSAELIKGLNAEFGELVNGPVRACQYLVEQTPTAAADRLPPEASDILVIDQGGAQWTREVFGSGDTEDALPRLVEAMASRPMAANITIRCHPFSESRTHWERVVSRFSHRGCVSLSTRSLPDDLARHGICIGLFSTVIPEAAASGMATLIPWQPGWFYTPDLSPFAELFTMPAELPALVDDMVRDEALRADYRRLSLDAAERYLGADLSTATRCPGD